MNNSASLKARITALTVPFFCVAFLGSGCSSQKPEASNQPPSAEPVVSVYLNELNYFDGVTTSKVLKEIESNGFVLRKSYPPEKIKTSDQQTIHNKFFINHYRKIYDENSECDIIIYGYEDNLGSFDITVRDFGYKSSTKNP